LQTAGDARLEIDEASNEPDIPAAAATTKASGKTSGTRERLAWAAAALALVVAAGAAWINRQPVPVASDPLHLSIALPEDGEVRSLALSPDGRVVVVAAQIDNKYQLWIRRLDEVEFRPLAGTNLARVPFWSPDSRSIGFFADGKLKTISATGGPAQALCDIGLTGSGGTWNRDGMILYARTEPGPIFQVSASGGECKPLTKPAPDSSHRFPEFLPDGRHFFYIVGRGEESKRGVYVASLDDPNDKRVLVDQSSVSYVPAPQRNAPGRLIFLRGDTLMAQPFDEMTFETTGDPVAVVSHASVSNSVPQMAASVSANGELLFLSNGEITQDEQLAWLDRSGKELEKLGMPDGLRAIALAPDGNVTVLSILAGSTQSSGLWLRDLNRPTISRLTPPNNTTSSPVWSPDGKRIVFSGIRSGSAVSDLYWKDIGSAEEHLLLKSAFAKYASDWSRDGRYLVYTEASPQSGADIWILPNPSDTSGALKPFPFANTAFLESQGQISPDGHWIAYVSDESGQNEVYIRPFPSGDGKWRVSTAGGAEPRWRRDGRELFYKEGLIARLRLMAVAVTSGTSAPGAPSFGAPLQLFDVRSNSIVPQNNAFSYSPSSDGLRFLLHRLTSDVRPTLDVLLNWQTKIAR
jgi:Tol biopolymer transport system component